MSEDRGDYDWPSLGEERVLEKVKTLVRLDGILVDPSTIDALVPVQVDTLVLMDSGHYFTIPNRTPDEVLDLIGGE